MTYHHSTHVNAKDAIDIYHFHIICTLACTIEFVIYALLTKQAVNQTSDLLVSWDAMTTIWRHFRNFSYSISWVAWYLFCNNLGPSNCMNRTELLIKMRNHAWWLRYCPTDGLHMGTIYRNTLLLSWMYFVHNNYRKRMWWNNAHHIACRIKS